MNKHVLAFAGGVYSLATLMAVLTRVCKNYTPERKQRLINILKGK